MPTLLPLWRAARTTGKQCGLTATGDYQPSLRSPWLAAAAREFRWRVILYSRITNSTSKTRSKLI
ncbi:MAG: hypothetical protein ROD09_00345 [Candidatus Sedimenticola sp. (ex Thyasira tokunagai)]